MPAVTYNYIAMPITHHIMLLVWLEPNFQHNTFVYNFLDHESSVVTYDHRRPEPRFCLHRQDRRAPHPLTRPSVAPRGWGDMS